MLRGRVLIVDDEPAMLQVVGRMLAQAGFEVVAAAGARVALEVISRGTRLDLIISDISMPDMGGRELLAEVRRLSPSTVAVLMSVSCGGNGVPADVPCLRKPFSTAELMSVLDRVFG